ncbi:MAG: 6,7-dimethyl-8-ribityllumazine synthase [Akkermansia sp.]|nr:6,7-dimethyl-8-ribityllumazine synthase [Akkermansia sp.]MBQ8376073.1 6,7-dimethyl-8-ribityllumazine synthase [Akkermansia sp.]
MSTELPQKVQSRVAGGRITIVAARYNEKYTDALLQNCLDELAESAAGVEVEVVRVPGAFEVPMMVKRAIEKPVSGETPDAVIAFGVILRGSTAHADLIGTAITNQLMDMSCNSLVPVIHEVLLLNNEEQAFARCVASSLNRGREAARAALEMLNVLYAQKQEIRFQARRNSVSRTGSLI